MPDPTSLQRSPAEEAQRPTPDEERTATGRNPDGERTGAWAASGELAQRPSAVRRAEEQLAVNPELARLLTQIQPGSLPAALKGQSDEGER